MGLDEVVTEVASNAQREAADVRSTGSAERERILFAASEKADALDAEAMRQLEARIATMQKRELASQSLEDRKYMLDMEKSLMDRVYAEAWKKVCALPENSREAIIRACMDLARDAIDAKFVHCSKRDEKIVSKIAFDMEVLADLESMGGIVVEDNSHERIDNYAFETVLEITRSKTAPAVYRMLFGGRK